MDGSPDQFHSSQCYTFHLTYTDNMFRQFCLAQVENPVLDNSSVATEYADQIILHGTTVQ